MGGGGGGGGGGLPEPAAPGSEKPGQITSIEEALAILEKYKVRYPCGYRSAELVQAGLRRSRRQPLGAPLLPSEALAALQRPRAALLAGQETQEAQEEG